MNSNSGIVGNRGLLVYTSNIVTNFLPEFRDEWYEKINFPAA
jgi:hypothetical protein